MKIGDKNIVAIGITGTIGAGKSLAGKILEDLGIPVIDTDKIVHELLTCDDRVKEQIKKEFPTVINYASDSSSGNLDNESGNDQINRKELAKIVFAKKEAKTKLESILHPLVREVCKQKTIDLAASGKKPKAIATLVPLLFEAKRQHDYDQIWTIYCDENILRQRLAKRDGYSLQEIDSRLAAQLSQAEKCELADRVLDNSRDENHLRQQIIKNLGELKIFLPDLNNNLAP